MTINKKKIKKLIKIALIVLVIVALLNFVYTPTSEAKVSDDLLDACANIVSNILDGLMGLLFWPFRLLILLMGKGLEVLLGFFVTGSEKVSIENILFNKIEVLSIDFMNVNGTENTAAKILRQNVASWYTGIRNLSAAVLIVICIYTGIRMALATPSDRAKYKEMLINWISSVALLFVLHYVIAGVIALNNMVVNAIGNGVAAGGTTDALNDLADSFFKEGLKSIGFAESTAYVACYLTLTFMTFTFIIMYLKRLITIAFLIIIAPLVTITYSIDKMGDGKAQGLNNWFKEFTYNIIIQPFHCIAYAALGGMATALATSPGAGLAEGVACIIIIAFIMKSEKILKTIFHMQSDSMMDALSSAAIAANISNRAMQFSKQVSGSVKQGIKANRANAEEIRKVKDEIRIAQGKTTRAEVKSKNAARKQKQNDRAKKREQFRKDHPKISGFQRDFIAFEGTANATLFNGITAFSMGLAQGDENAAIMTGLRQAEGTYKERKKQGQEFKQANLQHNLASAYNDYRDREIKNITEKFKQDPNFAKMKDKDQTDLIERTFDRKVNDLLTKGAITNMNDDKEKALVHAMDDLRSELEAEGVSGENAMKQVKGVVSKIAAGEIGEISDRNISFQAGGREFTLPTGTVADYEFGDLDVGGHRTNKEVIEDHLRSSAPVTNNTETPSASTNTDRPISTSSGTSSPVTKASGPRPGPAKGARTIVASDRGKRTSNRPTKKIKPNNNFTNMGPANTDRRMGNSKGGRRPR